MQRGPRGSSSYLSCSGLLARARGAQQGGNTDHHGLRLATAVPAGVSRELLLWHVARLSLLCGEPGAALSCLQHMPFVTGLLGRAQDTARPAPPSHGQQQQQQQQVGRRARLFE